jgi:hypothetical protein
MVCPNCGATAKAEEVRCATCGGPLSSAGPTGSGSRGAGPGSRGQAPATIGSRLAWTRLGLLGAYLVIGAWIIGGFIVGPPAMTVLGLVCLFALVLLKNTWQLRRRIPPFNSQNRLAIGSGWAGLVAVLLVALSLTYGPGTAGPASQSAADTALAPSPGSSPTPALSPSASVSISPSPSATQRPTSNPSPAATPTPTSPPPPPPPPPNTCGAPANPWGYNFCAGNVIYSPPSTFCNYFNCIPSFWTYTNGYVEECADATYSHSGGRSGSCSHHGGNLRALLAA